MHEMLGDGRYDELVVAIVSCKPVPSSILTTENEG